MLHFTNLHNRSAYEQIMNTIDLQLATAENNIAKMSLSSAALSSLLSLIVQSLWTTRISKENRIRYLFNMRYSIVLDMTRYL